MARSLHLRRETALMNSLEGTSRQSASSRRSRRGRLFGMPTTNQQRRDACRRPHIINRGAAWYAASALSSRRLRHQVISVCGDVQRPGTYEITLGLPMRGYLTISAGCMLPGRTLRR